MAITEVDERLLVRAYQAGDERAFDTIVRTQWKALYAHALKRLSEHDAAEDAVQDTLLRAYRALPKLSGDLALRAWLHRILTNVCYDEGNRRRRMLLLEEKVLAQPEETVPDAAEEAVLHDTVRIMAEALQGLPDSYREALVLRYVDGLSFREVAEATHTTEENARARAHRGRIALNKILSRIAVVLAFVIPGLKRTQEAPAATETATAAPAANLITQLTSHAASAAPAVSSVATQASMLPGGKTALLTGAVAAAAAITVPVGVYTVNEVRKPDQARPAAVAAPFDAVDRAAESSTSTTAPLGNLRTIGEAALTPPTTVAEAAPSTTSTLPPSATRPFEAPPAEPDQGTTTTTTPPQAAPPPPPAEEPAPTITRGVTGAELAAEGDGPNVDLAGAITIGEHPGDLAGRLTVHDDGVVSAELEVVVHGTTYLLRIRGAVFERADGAVRFVGKFSLPGGSAIGMPETGDVVQGTFQRSDGTARLDLELRGPEGVAR